MAKLITVPFGWLLGQLYHLTDNYGAAMIIFALIVQTVLLPIRAKSKKSMMKMSRLQPRIQEIQRKYANDQQKQNEAINKLQQEEGASMGLSGCLWTLVPLFILFPLFTVIREPMTYILGLSADVSAQIIAVIKEAAPELFSSKYTTYEQVFAAQAISDYAPLIKEAIPNLAPEVLEGIKFNFLGVNLGAVPSWRFWTWEAFSWSYIGAALIPLISTGSQVLQMWISQKLNNSVVTDKNGVQDEEMAKNSQAAQTSQMMMYTMPMMNLIIGFSVSAGLSLYWFIGGVYSMVSDFIMTKHYRKVYDEEDAARMKRHLEEERIEAEKERIRAERRAANPEGITNNTSKKKMQKKLRDEENATKAAAAREYAAKKGIVLDEAPEKQVMSGIPSRPYCKGRNYDPDRYSASSTEE